MPSRTVQVAPERLAGWLDRFATRHGEPATRTAPDAVVLVAPDGATAQITLPCPPLDGSLVEHVTRPRRLGLVLVRRGGWAVGTAVGGELAATKVGRRYVQGRTAAGGWSQQRYARRRAGQTAALLEDAIAAAARLLPGPPAPDLLVGGGDRQLLRTLRGDPRLAGLADRWAVRVLDVPEPRREVLDTAVALARAVQVTVTEPG